MALDDCSPCSCDPAQFSRTTENYRAAVLRILCEILAASGGGGGAGVVRYDVEFLCDPGTGDPVIVRYSYNTDGTVNGLAAFNLDLTAYGGVITDLVACGGGSSAPFAYPEDSAHVTGDTGAFILAIRQDASTVLTSASGDYSGVSVSAQGNLRVNVTRIGQISNADDLLKLEDVPHATGDAGVFALAVRNSAAAVLTSASGDYSPIGVNLYGSVYTDVDIDHQAVVSTGLLKREDAVSGDGDAGVAILFKRQDTPVSQTSADGDYSQASVTESGYQYVDPVLRATPTESNPSIPNATSTTISAANPARRYLLVQNNSGANIMISLSGGVLTGIVPSTANPGLLLVPGASYESPPNFCSNSAITVYQTSGGAIETISVVTA